MTPPVVRTEIGCESLRMSCGPGSSLTGLLAVYRRYEPKPFHHAVHLDVRSKAYGDMAKRGEAVQAASVLGYDCTSGDAPDIVDNLRTVS
jgi:hypothetical protein